MAKKKEETSTELAPEAKEEVKKVVKEEAKKASNFFGRLSSKCKEFCEKDFGGFKGKHILIALCAVVLVVILISCCKGSGEIEYPLVYESSEGEIMLIGAKTKEKDATKLANEGSTDVTYANTTNRYVIFSKNDALYLYDAKDKDETTKIIPNAVRAEFTPNDKYIYAIDKESVLYSVVPGKEKEKLDSDVDSYYGASDSKIVYTKEDTLYIRSLKASKDDRKKITNKASYVVFKPNDNIVLYSTEDGDIYSYNINKDKSEKIVKEVDMRFECAEETCEQFIYAIKTEDKQYDIYYYDGKKGTKIIKEYSDSLYYDIENKLFIYNSDDTFYFKNGTKDPYEIDDTIKLAGFLDDDAVYYINDNNELYIAKINGKKLGSAKKIGDDVKHLPVVLDGKLAFVSDTDDHNCGDLYIATTSKAKRIDSDVYYLLKTNNDKTKVYYLKDFAERSGELYYTKGSKGKLIDTDVAYYTYITDDLIYYIKDYSTSKRRGDLYRYTGSSKRVAESISSMSDPNK